MQVYQDPDLFQVELKSDRSPLTAADQASNALICAGLTDLDSGIPIVSEENMAIDYEVRRHFEYCWMVDPLDGTKEFIQRNGEFSVNIALICRDEAVLGVVYVPVSAACFWAVKGGGAFRRQDGRTVPLRCAPFRLTDSGLRILTSRSHLSVQTHEYLRRFDQPTMIPQGSALKFTLIAEGGGDVYPRLGPTMEWDTAAAQVVVEEAGGRIADLQTGQPLRYNKPSLLNPDFVAYGAEQA